VLFAVVSYSLSPASGQDREVCKASFVVLHHVLTATLRGLLIHFVLYFAPGERYTPAWPRQSTPLRLQSDERSVASMSAKSPARGLPFTRARHVVLLTRAYLVGTRLSHRQLVNITEASFCIFTCKIILLAGFVYTGEDQPSTDTQAEDSILRGREKDGLGASVPARLGSIRTC
jgi:hypothetical protein